MKTETATQRFFTPLQAVENLKPHSFKNELRAVYKSDLRNHRFALIENKTVQNSEAWDHCWFTNYE